ncbi:beta-lactamase [Halogeometricum pallidum JCM 14848]|uniref:Beta-lactamase n=1 Tax=Halogeometricum pallidum JCM 14848 TaxID=1227487 RepID=M0CZS1_HALPD|nr:MBL fold metallo-hydrolase [Halogeometricum pallidum]ELZ27389.1 beta-lactamase [Halogeometricum pallidum JCM 14848]
MTEPHRIAVNEGSPEGSNSAYVLPDRGVVVDPGPPGDDDFERLRAGIEAAGLASTDVEHVVLTHWHADHVGLAPRLADAADATIHMHWRDAPLLAEYREARRRRTRRDAAVLARWGVPAERIEEVRKRDAPSALPDRTPVVAHEGGDAVAGGELLHTPGHTEGHLAFRCDGALFVGDTVLPTYTPNVGGSDTRAENPLPDYLRTLRRLLRHDGECYPGHGEGLSLPERVETIRAHHRERAERVAERVDGRGEGTPWEIAVDLFGEMRGVHVKFGAGEAAAHLRALAAESAVSRVGSDPERYALDGSSDGAVPASLFE